MATTTNLGPTGNWLRHHGRFGAAPLLRVLTLGLVLYLSLYLIAGGGMTAQAWARGRHVTPAQQGYHVLLQRFGFEHHVSIEGSNAVLSPVIAGALLMLAPAMPAIDVGPGNFATFFSAALLLAESVSGATVAQSVATRLSPIAVQPPATLAMPPLTPPPRSVC